MSVAIFCDANSLWFYAKLFGRRGAGREGPSRVDYQRLRNHLADGRRVECCYLYAHPREGEHYSRFTTALKHMGYQVCHIDKEAFIPDAIQKHAEALPTEADTIVIAGGDGDYSALINWFKEQGKSTEVHAFDIDSPIHESKQLVDRFSLLPASILEADADSEARRKRRSPPPMAAVTTRRKGNEG